MGPLTKYGQWLVFSTILWTDSLTKNKVKVLLLTSESSVTYKGQVGLNPKIYFPIIENYQSPFVNKTILHLE